MKITIIGSDKQECGIAEHADMMREALVLRGHTVEVQPPIWDLAIHAARPDVVILDHHAAVHAAWTPERVAALDAEVPVVVIQHDTFETRELMDERRLPDFVGVAEKVLIHEEVRGYGTLFPMPLPNPLDYFPDQTAHPTVALVGFDFPWKNFELVERHARELGVEVRRIGGAGHFRGRGRMLNLVARCWGAVFFYVCGNSGQSGAIGVGLAAKIPVWAHSGCRQFRELRRAESPVTWGETEGDLRAWLKELRPNAPGSPEFTARAGFAENYCWRGSAINELELELYNAVDRNGWRGKQVSR